MKPREIKKSEGTYRPDRDRNRGVEFKGVSKLNPPQDFTKSQKKLFNSLVKELGIDGYNMLTTMDSLALGLLTEVYDEYLTIKRIIDTDGHVIQYKNINGEISSKPHHLVPYKRQVFNDVLKMLKEFGLTATSRNRVAFRPTAEEKKDDDWNF
jgi:P27 family predicted phage terminase small subunit